jgi:type 1 glutamine amidotransferase
MILAMAAFGLRAGEEIDPYDQSIVPLEQDSTDPNLAKIVMVPGVKSHGPNDHEYFAGLLMLSDMLKQTPGVTTVMTKDGWPKNEKVFEGAKAIVFFSDGRGGHPLAKPGRLDVLQKQIDAKAGFVCLHYAVDYNKAEGERVIKWLGGFYDVAISTNPFWVADYKTLPEHPITNGVKPFSFRDEWYYNMRFVPDMKNVTVILKAVPPDNTRGTADAKSHPGREEVTAWAYEREDGGRSFGFTGGHSHKFWANDDYRRIVVNGILWSAKIEVPKTGAKCDLINPLDRALDWKGKGPKPEGKKAPETK